MNVTRIIHKAKDNNARVLLNHTLYGRLVYKKYRGRKYAYYIKGLLDDIKFVKKPSGGECLIFGEVDREQLQDILDIFGNIIIEDANFVEDELNELECNSYTGREYWKRKANEVGLEIRERQRKRRHGN